jgi:hypothetical protein
LPRAHGETGSEGIADSGAKFAGFLAMASAVVIDLGIMGLKFYGYWLKGSSAILADEPKSIINFFDRHFQGMGEMLMHLDLIRAPIPNVLFVNRSLVNSGGKKTASSENGAVSH